MKLIDFIVTKLDALKAKDILTIDVKNKSSITDSMILCTGTSSRHVSSLAQKLIDDSKQAGLDVFGEEGRTTADWVVVDFGEVMVHILQAESRDMYQLEKLWM